MLENVNWEWDNIIGKMQTMHCKNNLKSILSKIGVAACVYNIWRERNIRFFQDKKGSEDVIIREIIEDIKWKLSSFIVTEPKLPFGVIVPVGTYGVTIGLGEGSSELCGITGGLIQLDVP
ncbi:hypothetical protein Tco_0802288 [Tanacetum coccineum]|uniref:Transposase n=1 Tax=Tanacetum coccineum TaxID=301880 RepID=A0ABQ5A2F0_9ASTR